MIGILGVIITGVGVLISSSRTRFAEIQERQYMKNKGSKFYTDSHGNQRDVDTNRIIPLKELHPRPLVKMPVDTVWKVVKKYYDDERVELVDYFKSNSEAYKCLNKLKEIDQKKNPPAPTYMIKKVLPKDYEKYPLGCGCRDITYDIVDVSDFKNEIFIRKFDHKSEAENYLNKLSHDFYDNMRKQLGLNYHYVVDIETIYKYY